MSVSRVEFREITNDNRNAVIGLSVRPDQTRFVSSVAESLEEADEYPEGNPWFRAVYLGEEPVGFVMLSWNVAPDPPRIIGPWFLWKLLVDWRYQRLGLGREVVRLVSEIVRAEGAGQLLTSYGEGNGGPGPFYDSLGFRPTGDRDEDGEIITALQLD